MEQRLHEDASDSEDDPDYVPDNDGASSDRDREAKRQRTSSPRPDDGETEEQRQAAREALWEQFRSSAASAPAVNATVAPSKMVKIEKRYRFAGEEVREVKEVPEDSEEAKKWPRWHESDNGKGEAGPSSQFAVTADGPSSNTSAASTPTPSASKPAKRPGPRKSKIALAPLPGAQKAKKLTTLGKSAMDWRSHVESTAEPVKDALEANRRGGGYLEKVEFLQRVADRKEDALEATKSTKRRR